MKHIAAIIAYRYIRGTRNEKNIAIMVKICFWGILIGSFSLALVMAVMNGFEKATHEKMQGIHAQVIVRTYDQELNLDILEPVLETEFPEIEAYSPSTIKQVIMQRADSDDVTNVVMIKGINPSQEKKINVLGEKLITPNNHETLENVIYDDAVLIGDKLAETLDLDIGDVINLLFAEDERSHSLKIRLNQTKARIGGIFKTGIDEFDTSLVFCTLSFLQKIFGDAQPTQINIKLKPWVNEEAFIDKLKKRLNDIDVYSWKELYPALVSALRLEKYVMFFILALITLVASMNIISLLFMQIIQKRGDIAILKAMGLADKHIRSIFLYMGMGISLIASIMGLLLATIVSWLLEHYPFITLPDAYYVTHLPAKMDASVLGIVFLAIMLISFISTLLPTRTTRSINIAKVLRFEA